MALAEAYDSGLPSSRYREFGGDIDNLTVATPSVNRKDKSDKDTAQWLPPRNRGWYAARVVAVKRKYGLSVDAAERHALAASLTGGASRQVACRAIRWP